MRTLWISLAVLAAVSCSAESPTSTAPAAAAEPAAADTPAAGTAATPAPEPAADALLHPERATETAPAVFRVEVDTTKGPFVIRVERDWAPHGADRFYNLVKLGYYDDTYFFRVIRDPHPFMAQVGFSGDPAVTAAWQADPIPDDPPTHPNVRGTVTFAMTSNPNSRTTQFFVNYADNSYLTEYGAFAPIGEVEKGMEVVDSLYAGYGEGAPQGSGPAQGRIAKLGNPYLQENFPKLDRIVTARIVE